MDLRNECTVYLKADDVRRAPLRLTIRGCRSADANDARRRPVVLFREDDWALPLNKQNLRTVKEAFGYQTLDWHGKVVEAFYDDSVVFDGQLIGGVRLRIPAGQPTTTEPETAAAAEIAF
jgi:hypothetical protein